MVSFSVISGTISVVGIYGHVVLGHLRKIESENSALTERIRYDYLTGLLNRDYCEELISAKNLSQDEVKTCAIILADIDDFRRINEAHTHISGDKVLQGLALILRQAFRKQDKICRWGEEEFIIDIYGLQSKAELQNRAEYIASLFEAESFEGRHYRLCIGGCFSSIKKLSQREYEEMLKVADKNLYIVKNSPKVNFECSELLLAKHR